MLANSIRLVLREVLLVYLKESLSAGTIDRHFWKVNSQLKRPKSLDRQLIGVMYFPTPFEKR
jgi:hypothetical protein